MLLLSLYKKTFFKKLNQKGSLVINLLVVVGIVALLTAVFIPYLRKYQPNLKLNSVSRDLTSDLRYAQQLTITEQVVYWVYFNTIEGSYEIIRTGAATTTIREVYLPTEVSYKEINDLTGNIVSFNSYGGVSESGQIILTNTNDRISIINIKPSGYVQLIQ